MSPTPKTPRERISAFGEQALVLAERGYAVFPCKPKDKFPATPHGFKDATDDPDQIRKWWSDNPRANIGIACGESGILVLDVDAKAGGDWEVVVPEWGGDAPVVFTGTAARSEEYPDALDGSRGAHIYFRNGAGVRNRKLEIRGCETRGVGGYVLAPGSVHPDGTSYGGEELPPVDDLPPAPDLPVKSRERQSNGTVAAGERHDALLNEATRLHRAGVDSDELRASLHALNDGFESPKGADEVDSIAEWACNLPTHFPNSDPGNAERFAVRSQKALRYVPERKDWLAWDGKRWLPNCDGEAMRQAVKSARAIFAEAAEIDDKKRRDAVLAHAKASERRERLNAAIEIGKTDLRLVVHVEDLDADPFLLNVENGTLDLRTGELREHTPDDLISNLAPVVWVPGAQDDVLDEFLWNLFADRAEELEELLLYLQRYCGYGLTGSVKDERFLSGYGPSATGKSTLIEAFVSMLGDYADSADYDTFCKQRFPDTTREKIARIAGKRVIACSEISEGNELDVALINGLVTGERTTGRFRYGLEFSFNPQAKFVFVANERPKAHASKDSIYRRMDHVPFTNSHIDAPDLDIKEHLVRDPHARSALLAWAVEGCLAWQEEGLNTPSAVQAFTDEYRSENDPVIRWIDEVGTRGEQHEELSSDLLRLYNAWADEAGEKKEHPTTFAQALAHAGLKKRHTERGTIWTGLQAKRVRRGNLAS